MRRLLPGWLVSIASRLRAEFQLAALSREGRSIRLEEFSADGEELSLTSIPEDPWNMRLFEVAALCLLGRRMGAKNVLEIGTFDGRTAINLVRSLGKDSRVTTVNLPISSYPADSTIRKRGVGHRFVSREEATRIEQIFADSATLNPVSFGRKFDMVFIDGAHTYAYARSDTDFALDILVRRPQSLIVWDDVHYHGVQRAIRDLELEKGIRFYHLAQTKLAFAFPFCDGARFPPERETTP